MIDYILETTRHQKLFYAGHSQGSTAFYVMASERPEYNDKIKAMFSLAPVAYCSKMFSPIMQFLARIVKPINVSLSYAFYGAYLPYHEIIKRNFCCEIAAGCKIYRLLRIQAHK